MARAGAGTEELRLAEMHLAAGRFAQAVELLRTAIRLDRDSPRPRLMLAYALSRAGETDDAVKVLRRVADAFPRNADVWFNLGNLYRTQHRLENALQAFERAAALRPEDPAPQVNLVYLLVRLGRFGGAEAAVRAALARFPSEADLLVNLAQIQRATHRLEGALATLDRCVALAPEHAGYLLTRAIVLGEAGETHRAKLELDTLVRRHPADPHAYFMRAQLLLSGGEFQRGWRDYLRRPDRMRWLHARGKAPDEPSPAAHDLRSRNVVLCGEQGLGDTLFFLRFAPAVAELASSVRLEVDARLRVILPPHWQTPEGIGNEAYVLVGDLPAILDSSTQPSLELEADPERIVRLRESLTICGPPPYRGVSWQGGVPWEKMATLGESHFKRVPPDALGSAISVTDGTWLSLQRDGTRGDLEAIRAAAARPIHDFSWVNEDLADALALLHHLQDYVAVSNTNVHLNEALGKRTRVLVTNPAEWRWMREGGTSPWFAGAMIYRQAQDGSWDEALKQLAADLRQ